VPSKRRAQTYPNWMFQRPVDFYHSLEDTSEIDQLLEQVGFGDTLQTKLKNRLIRPNNILKFAD